VSLFLSELLRKKDEQIMSLLEEKVKVFRDMCEGPAEETRPTQSIRTKMLFRATPDDITKGEPIMKDALREGDSEWTVLWQRPNTTQMTLYSISGHLLNYLDTWPTSDLPLKTQRTNQKQSGNYPKIPLI
jgi:hypothetical protein